MKNWLCPYFRGVSFPKLRRLPDFHSQENPSSRLITVILYVPVFNRRKVMCGKAAKTQLTEEQQRILQQLRCSATAAKRLVQRAAVILQAFGGAFNVAIADETGLGRKQVGLWRRRWQQSFDALVAIECREPRAALRRAIEEVLGDAPRSGSSALSLPKKSRRLSLWHVNHHINRDGPLKRGPVENWPMKLSNVASSNPSPAVRSIAIWRKPNCSHIVASIG
jgi:hypothetical protein